MNTGEDGEVRFCAPRREALIEDPEAAQLSRLLFEAREIIDMFIDVVEAGVESASTHSGIFIKARDITSRRVRDEIDTYRAERGWPENGYSGHEH